MIYEKDYYFFVFMVSLMLFFFPSLSLNSYVILVKRDET